MPGPSLRWPLVTIVACFMSIAGCDNESVGVEQASAAATAGDPCSLLTTGEVAAVIPGAKSPKRDKSREQYGISACIWDTPGGRLVVQTWKSEPNAVENEARGLSAGFVDPLNAGAKNNVRFEKIDGVGEQALAVVEVEDAKRGILNDVAMLVGQRGDQVLVLLSNDLARAERSSALTGLKKLGANAAKRL
jgi:hypothetical protein